MDEGRSVAMRCPTFLAGVGLAAVILIIAAMAGFAVASEREASKLAAANEDLAAAETEIAALESEQSAIEPQVDAARQRFRQLDRAAREASAEAKTRTERLRNIRTAAAEEVIAADSAYEADRDSWFTSRGLLVALGALLLSGGLLVALWRQFTASGPMTGFSRQESAVHAAVIAVIAAAALAGLVGVIAAGSSGIVIVSGLLLGIGATALLGLLLALRGPPAAAGGPTAAPPSSAGIAPPLRTAALIVGLAGGLAAVVAGVALSAPERSPVDQAIRALAAAGDPLDDPTPELAKLLTKEDRRKSSAARAKSRYDQLKARPGTLQEDLSDARSKAEKAEEEVAKWEAALAEPDPPDVEPEPSPAPDDEPDAGSGCDPNYSGCVPLYPPDVDCADVAGPVQVYGSDPHGLDADNDGVGCES